MLKYVDEFINHKDDVIKDIKAKIDKDEYHGCTYKDLLEIACKHIEVLDETEITMIDNGDYQGTLLFAIPFDTYQPDEREYVFTYVGYGSCSGCDTLMSLFAEYDWDDKDMDKLLNGLYTLTLHMVERMKTPWGIGE